MIHFLEVYALIGICIAVSPLVLWAGFWVLLVLVVVVVVGVILALIIGPAIYIFGLSGALICLAGVLGIWMCKKAGLLPMVFWAIIIAAILSSTGLVVYLLGPIGVVPGVAIPLVIWVCKKDSDRQVHNWRQKFYVQLKD